MARKLAMGGTVTDIEGETRIIRRGAGPRAAWAQLARAAPGLRGMV